jgi:hypothetical protein
MGSCIIKASPQEDLYLEWSTVVEAPTAVGTRKQMAEYLRVNGSRDPESRLARADSRGSSAWDIDLGGWRDEYLIYQQQGLLPRDRLAEAARRLLADERASLTDLLLPFDDES